MCSDVAIRAENLSKVYPLYDRPADRLKQMLFRGRRQYYRAFSALQNVSFELKKGEVLGLVGRNGAGKSTLLQLICGTLTPSSGQVTVNGRVAALLELGSGFNPEFTGRENVYLNASILGLSKAEIDARYDDIVAFSGIGDFIHQPVKNYSSGMYVRLAFAIATSVDPDILIVDEALSVGDGAFARKSFDRIMQLKAKGATILFCSHSMFQIEAFCNQVIWLDGGVVRGHGPVQQVVTQYAEYLDQQAIPSAHGAEAGQAISEGLTRIATAEIVSVPQAFHDGVPVFRTGEDVALRINFCSDPARPTPTVGITILTSSEITIASAGSFNDGYVLQRGEDGRGEVSLRLNRIPLLKGYYYISIFLLCENGVLVLDTRPYALKFRIDQVGLEQGIVTFEHEWSQGETA